MNVRKIPLPGFRTIKTAIAILACLLLYSAIGRNDVLLAVFAAFICLQDSIRHSVENGVNRVTGVIIGGLFGLLLTVAVGGARESLLLWYAVISLGVIVLIYAFNLMKRNDSISMGAIVFLVIMLDSGVGSPLLYAVNYVIDSVIGIAIAVAVNHLPLGSANERGVFKSPDGKTVRLSYDIIRKSNLSPRKWSGGETTELAISPENAVFADRKFDWRISTATTTVKESIFTDFGGFKRHIMVLEGALSITHEGHHSADLPVFGQDYFDGGWHTSAKGVCRDFNLILSPGFDGKLLTCQNNAICFLKGVTQSRLLNSVCAVYSLAENISFAVFCDEKPVIQCRLDAGDIIVFERLDKIDGALKFIASAKEADADSNVCVAVYIAEKN